MNYCQNSILYCESLVSMVFLSCHNSEPARPLQRSLRPSGPEIPKKSRKCLPKSLQKVSGTVRKDSCDTFRRLPKLFPRLFGVTFRETFSRFFRHISGPKDLCKGQKTRESCGCFWDLLGGSRKKKSKFGKIAGKLLETRIAKCFKF